MQCSCGLVCIYVCVTVRLLSLSLSLLELFFFSFFFFSFLFFKFFSLSCTRLYLTETHFFWEEEDRKDPKIDRNQIATGVTLYELKFITTGKSTDNFKKADFKKIPKGM
jgi:hypothetical protein